MTHISRKRLLFGSLATGVLAACGGGSVSAPVAQPQLCTPVPDDLPWLDQALANAIFASFDKQTLLNQFDRSSAVQALQQPYFDRTGQVPQQGSVIAQIPSAGIVITSPGIYTLVGNISWNPQAAYAAAITIASSNVTLIMSGSTLTNTGADASLHTAAILVKGPVETVVINGGTLAGFTEYGVLAAHACGFVVSNVTVTGLRLNDTAAREVTPAGIFASYSHDVNVRNCTVSGADITTDAGAGIQLIRANLASVSNCTVHSLVNNAGGMQGFSYLACENIATVGCTADSMQTFYGNNNLTSGHTCIGYLPTLCFGLQFTNCVASNITGCCDDAHGLSVFLCGDVTVSHFQASNVVDGVLSGAPFQSGAKATGIEVYSLLGALISNSTVDGISAHNPQDLQAAGFSAWGPGIEFTGCSAKNVAVFNDTAVPDMRGIGFGWAPDPRPGFDGIPASGVKYTDCTAERCDVAFDTWYHQLSTWTGTSYTQCATGYLTEFLGTRTLSCNPCSECPNPPYTTQPYLAHLINIAFGNTHP